MNDALLDFPRAFDEWRQVRRRLKNVFDVFAQRVVLVLGLMWVHGSSGSGVSRFVA
jgi:hypothetical protein